MSKQNFGEVLTTFSFLYLESTRIIHHNGDHLLNAMCHYSQFVIRFLASTSTGFSINMVDLVHLPCCWRYHTEDTPVKLSVLHPIPSFQHFVQLSCRITPPNGTLPWFVSPECKYQPSRKVGFPFFRRFPPLLFEKLKA